MLKSKLAMALTLVLALGACDSIANHLGAGPGSSNSTAEASPVPAAAPSAQLDQAQVVPVQATQGEQHQAAAPSTAHARFTIDTPLGQLAANPQAKAIVDHYAPGMTEGPHAVMAAAYSLRQIHAQMPGMISEATLNQMSTELAALN